MNHTPTFGLFHYVFEANDALEAVVEVKKAEATLGVAVVGVGEDEFFEGNGVEEGL